MIIEHETSGRVQKGEMRYSAIGREIRVWYLISLK